MPHFNYTVDSTFEQWFSNSVYYCMQDLSTALLIRNKTIKCNYFLRSHFLARYLKVRCFIDCNRPHAEALAEFAAHKTNLNFERIIQRFLLRSLRNIGKYLIIFKRLILLMTKSRFHVKCAFQRFLDTLCDAEYLVTSRVLLVV